MYSVIFVFFVYVVLYLFFSFIYLFFVVHFYSTLKSIISLRKFLFLVQGDLGNKRSRCVNIKIKNIKNKYLSGIIYGIKSNVDTLPRCQKSILKSCALPLESPCITWIKRKKRSPNSFYSLCRVSLCIFSCFWCFVYFTYFAA